MSEAPIWRGVPAPPGFAASVTSWLQRLSKREREQGTSPATRTIALACGSRLPALLGDQDGRIRILALSTTGDEWTPGPEQRAVIDAAGRHGRLTGDQLLSALCHAATLDLLDGVTSPVPPQVSAGGTMPRQRDIPVLRRRKLPEGVRKHGRGYQAYWRDVHGKNRAKGGFATVAEAEAFARDQKLHVARHRQMEAA